MWQRHESSVDLNSPFQWSNLAPFAKLSRERVELFPLLTVCSAIGLFLAVDLRSDCEEKPFQTNVAVQMKCLVSDLKNRLLQQFPIVFRGSALHLTLEWPIWVGPKQNGHVATILLLTGS